MAAIDKLYVREYYEYDDLLRWSIAYYPELLFYFYSTHLTYNDFEKMKKDKVKEIREANEKELKKIGGTDVSLRTATYNLIDYYRKEVDYECSYDQAKYEAESILETASKTDDELEDMFRYPCLNTPLSVDRKLKWICPVPCVRRYLQEQCGVDPKWELLYCIFWKGKKHF